MLRRAITAVALALASAGGIAAHAQAQLDPRFVAFRDDCVETLHSLADTQKRIKTAGWVSVDPASHAELKKIYDHTRKLSSYAGVSFDAYSRTVGRGRLYMIITGNLGLYSIDDYRRENQCAVYDLDDNAFAPDPDADRAVERWLGAAPVTKTSNPKIQVSNKDWDDFSNHPNLHRVGVQSIGAGENARYWIFTGRMWSAEARVRQ